MKKLLLSTFALLSAFCASAQQTGIFVKHRLADGTLTEVRKMGNGQFFFYADKANNAYLPNENGTLARTSLTAEGLVVDSKGTATASEALEVLTKRFAQANTRESRAAASTTDGMGEYGTSAIGNVASIGAPVIPIILAEFSDFSLQDTTTLEKMNRWLNEAGYTDSPIGRGSVRDYFIDQSRNMFQPTFQVVAKVTLSKERTYYGQDKGSTTDVNLDSGLQEAIELAMEAGVDFSAFKNGSTVPTVGMIYAGPGENSAYEDGSENYIWPKKVSHAIVANGVRFTSYFVINEMLNNYYKDDGTFTLSASGNPIVVSTRSDGIGTFCHEFSHVLGLPDVYYTGSNATVSDTLNTMGYWSVMDRGNFCFDGYRPLGYSAYERSFMGWQKVIDLEADSTYTLYPLTSTDDVPTAYRILCEDPDSTLKVTDDYYILEYRKPGTWYAKSMGSGLFITRYRYYRNAWANNVVNNDPAIKRYSYIPADGSYAYKSISDLAYDLFGGVGGVTTFTGQFGKIVKNISVTDDYITFNYGDVVDAIENILTPEGEDRVEVFALDGRRIGAFASQQTAKAQLPAGVYVIKANKSASKIIVR